MEKLIEHFVRSYKVKGIVSSNAIELKLPSSIKIYSVVNISRVHLYKPQIKGQKRMPLKPVGYIAEENTWERKEILKNAKELVEEFEREYREEAKV